MNEKIINLVNQQIQKEFESAYLYFFFANYYEEKGLKGFASWFKAQAREEESHAQKFCDFLHDNNASVNLMTINEPNYVIEDLETPLALSLKHEEYVTDLINKIYAEAENREDFRTIQFLQWFIEEQAEEESTARGLIEKFNLVACSGEGIYLMDKDMGERKVC